MKNKILLFMGLVLLLPVYVQAQDASSLQKKKLADTVLHNRTLLMPGAFDGMKALRALFPGKYYDLSEAKYSNKLISWECKTCKTAMYNDVNADGGQEFPYPEGVATRLLCVLDFTDATGGQYKMLAFAHSVYDADGMQTSRFTGGLLGLAKFTKTNDGWLLRSFQPAIGAYGAFSSCPAPTVMKIGEDQYAFLVTHTNGPGGGPFDDSYFLIAGANGAYSEVMGLYDVTRKQPEEDGSAWESTIKATGDKKYFRDIVVATKGTYRLNENDDVPEEIVQRLKHIRYCKFSFTRRFIYSAGKGYIEQPITDFTTTDVKR